MRNFPGPIWSPCMLKYKEKILPPPPHPVLPPLPLEVAGCSVSVVVGRWTRDREVASSVPGRCIAR